MSAMSPVTDKLIEILDLKGDEHLLDVASGTGEPGLAISTLLPEGQVTGTDLSEKMVEIANDHARQRDIDNYRSIVCNTVQLPFEDHSFDHVICRFGILYFPDIEACLEEMSRVLKPGGKLAVTVWAGPENNSCFTLMGEPVMEKLDLPKPPPDAPGIFRFSQPGLASRLMKDAGFESVTESTIEGQLIFNSPEQYWELTSDVSGPIMEVLKNEPREVVEDIKVTVLSNARDYMEAGKVFTGWEAIVIDGVKTS